MSSTAEGVRLDVQRGPDWLLARIESLDSRQDGSVPLADVLWKLLESHLTYRLVLELDKVEVLNSHLIGQLVRLYKRIREHDGVMRLCGLSAHNCQVLRTCRLDDRFQPYYDRRAAVMAGSGSARSGTARPR